MDVIEVDPKLFVTCRLCLDDLGQFQIVPSVAQQIKYCFDIDVEPFDGLPQLICLKCKEVLNKFHIVKTTFCDKQAQLKNRVLKKEEISFSQHNTVSSSQQNELNSSVTAETKPSKNKNKRVIHSSSSDEAEPEIIAKPKTKNRKQARTYVNAWVKDYEKELVCKVCNSHWQKKASLSNHFRCHETLTSKYKHVFNRPCSVVLEKFDGKPNVTGESDIVMFSTNKMIKVGDTRFHTIYSKKAIIEENLTETNIGSKPSNETNISHHSSDDNDEIVVKPKSRSLRLVSKSSNDTVVLENYDKNVTSDNDNDSRTASQCSEERALAGNDICINIDDSESDSNSGNFDLRQRVKQPIEAKIGDYKIIQGIISMCVNAYQKRNEGTDIDTYINVMRNKIDKAQINNESQLKHKLLSLGRKIINRQGFNCTGLLRYMEHKNLDILWIPKQLPANKDTNYIRILTRLRGDATRDDSGWKYICENTILDDCSQGESILKEMLVSSGSDDKRSEQETKTSEINKLIEPNNTAEKDKLNEPNNIETVQQNVLNKQTEVENVPAVLYLSSNDNASSHNNVGNHPKKLLNANPVPNPKPFVPKKLGQTNERPSRPPAANQNVCHVDSEEANICMPIITATTSLATSTTDEQKEDSVPTAIAPKPAPRIKVKPASELMSERTLNSLRNETTASPSVSNILSSPTVWPHQQPINIYVPNITSMPASLNQSLQLVQIPCLTVSPVHPESCPNPISSNETLSNEASRNEKSNSSRDQVMLDTVEFPNTVTESPFTYFQNLLQMHNLVLRHPCELLSREYYCLIKFKVLFKKETKNIDKPVVLCLSLYCLKNKYCLKIKDGNQQNVDIDKISANWQWEILQIYRGDVVQRILENAQKISQETSTYTTKFFCLLKSINCKKM